MTTTPIDDDTTRALVDWLDREPTERCVSGSPFHPGPCQRADGTRLPDPLRDRLYPVAGTDDGAGAS